MTTALRERPTVPRRLLERRRATPGRVEIRCADCGYGGVVARLPGRCPMCGGRSWRLVAGCEPVAALPR